MHFLNRPKREPVALIEQACPQIPGHPEMNRKPEIVLKDQTNEDHGTGYGA
ncbi:hypothetical protein D3C81_2018490 [compost metagenome]